MPDYSNVPRDSRRVPLATSVQFKFDRFSGFLSEYSSNISPTGMFIVTENPEPPGRILDLEFRLGDGFEIIKGQGEVVWARTALEGPGRLPGMGIRFLELSPGSKELIYRIVDQFVAQGGTPFDLTGLHPAPPAPAAPAPAASETSEISEDTALPPLAREPDPFPDLAGLEGGGATVLPWSPASQKETPMSGEDVLPPLEPLDEIFRLEEVPPPGPASSVSPENIAPAKASAPARASAPPPGVLPFPGPPPAPPRPAPANDPFPLLGPDLDLTQAGPTVVGFDEPIPDPPSYPGNSSMPSPADDLFASYLPQPAAPPESPQVRPLSTLVGSASVQQPRRVFPWVLVGVLLAVAAAAFLLRGQISEWIGGGDEAEIVTAQQAPPLPRPSASSAAPTLQEEISSTSDAAASTPEQATQAPPAEPELQKPLPEVVQRKPAPAPAPAAPAPPSVPAVTAIDRITFEPALGGTTVVLWGNGAIRPESFKQTSISSPPREVIQIRGVHRPFAPTRIPVGTSEVKQIRVGYHEKPGGNELHVVIDLAGPRVKIARIEPDGQRLRIHLQAR